MRIESINRHLDALGITLERVVRPQNENRWSTTLRSAIPEIYLFSSAIHALRYWDTRSRDQISMLTALDQLARHGITQEQVANLRRWANLEIAPPAFLSAALEDDSSQQQIFSHQDMRHLCATHGPISSSWLRSSLHRRDDNIAKGKDVDSCSQWIWGQRCDKCSECQKPQATCASTRAIGKGYRGKQANSQHG